MQHIDVPQYSAAWFEARLGIPSASNADRILTPKTLKLSSQSNAYLHQLLAEWWLQTPFEEEVTVWWMEVGRTREEEAVRFFELTTGLATQECGFCTTEDGQVGCSPDRFVGAEDLLEIKCPTAPIQVKYLLAGDMPPDYILQVQMQLFVTGRRCVHFLSYMPNMPSLLLRIEPDPTYQHAIAVALREFCLRLEDGKRKLETLR